MNKPIHPMGWPVTKGSASVFVARHHHRLKRLLAKIAAFERKSAKTSLKVKGFTFPPAKPTEGRT